MDIMSYIKPELIIIVPVLYCIGMILKSTRLVNKWIPLILGGISVILCLIWVLSRSDIGNIQSFVGALFTAVTQGILTAGLSVYINQIYNQMKKK